MLTQQYRPTRFSEVKGAEMPKKILKAIVKSPENQPRALIFGGGRGLGKTTCLRIFIKALNCQNRADGDCCNQCDSCRGIAQGASPLYSEYDSSIVGNVDTMNQLKDSFGYAIQAGYKVVAFDEVHLVSKAAQGALLKTLEDAPSGVFFILLTTDVERILETIQSRSLPVEFKGLEDDDMGRLLRGIAEKEGIDLDDHVVRHICRRVKGHARDALQQLELVRLLGTDAYLLEVKVMDETFEKLIVACQKGEKQLAKSIVESIIQQPVLYVSQDFEIFVRRLVDRVYIGGESDKRLRGLAKFYLTHHRFLTSSSDWYIFLMSLLGLFEQKEAQAAPLAERFKAR